MAKTKISEFSATPGNNTDIDGINIAEGCAPSGINDAIRELMAQLKDWQSGTSNDPYVVGSSGSLTLSGGTANGVAYLNGSKVLTTGSALTFDGTNLSSTRSVATAYSGSNSATWANGIVLTNNATASSGVASLIQFAGAGNVNSVFGVAQGSSSYGDFVWASYTGSFSEQMRLTSTGLGIGTSSPAYKLDVTGSAVRVKSASAYSALLLSSDDSNASTRNWAVASSYNNYGDLCFVQSASQGGNPIGGTVRAALDSSGNLGLGVTPSAWDSGFRAFQVGRAAALWSPTNDAGGFYQSNNLYFDGSNRRYLTNNFATEYIQTSGQHVWKTAPSGTAGNAISFTQAMTLDASGNLGVGTTSPGVRLDVRGDSPTIQVGQAGSGNGANFGWVNGDGTVRLNTTGAAWPILFLQTGTERARIDSSGNLLVNTTSNPNASHQIWKNNPNGIVASLQNSNSTNGFVLDLVSQSASGTSFSLIRGYVAGGTQVFAVQGNGNVVNTNNSYGAISDAKLKENVTDATPKLEKLRQVRVVNYNLIGDEKKQIGVVAQELEQVFPGMVEETPDRDSEGNDLGTTTKSVKYSVFVPMLIKAIQELKAEFDAYKASHP
jgi:hypothetical protein